MYNELARKPEEAMAFCSLLEQVKELRNQTRNTRGYVCDKVNALVGQQPKPPLTADQGKSNEPAYYEQIRLALVECSDCLDEIRTQIGRL